MFALEKKDALAQFTHFLRLCSEFTILLTIFFTAMEVAVKKNIFLTAMEFGCINNERKIQRINLERGIIYGRRKPWETSYHASFQQEK